MNSITGAAYQTGQLKTEILAAHITLQETAQLVNDEETLENARLRQGLEETLKAYKEARKPSGCCRKTCGSGNAERFALAW